MTTIELKIANALQQCTFLPGHYDKQFCKQLVNWKDREMTDKGRNYMMKMLEKYKRQIPSWNELRKEMVDAQVSEIRE